MANISQVKLPNGTTYDIKDTISGYVATDATTSVHGLMSTSDKTKLNGIASGAEVNQNAFSNVKVGTTTVAADSKTDTLTLVGGANITLTPDATNDKITILLDDSVTTGEVIATEVQAGDLVVSGASRFINTINGTASNSEKLNGQSLTSTYSSTGTAPITGAAVASAIGALDGTVSGSPSASKTLTAFSQTDGKVSATFGNISITKSQVSDFPSLGTAAAKNFTTSVTSGSADLVTSGAVWSAIDNLPEPMVFKGSVGTGGTVTDVPVDGTAKVGDTYKVITDGTYGGKTAKIGDTLICLTKTSSANTWELIPSGDEPSGTVTSVGISNGGGLSVSGSPITSSGTITISHSDTSSQASVSNSGRTYIQSITLDTYGHVTKLTSATETVTNTDRYVNSAAFAHDSTNDNVKMTLTRAGSDTATVTANIPKVSSSSAGVAPKGATVSSQSQTTKFLREDGTWAAPSYTPVIDNLTSSTSTTSALSAKQGYNLANGSARDSTKVAKAGDTMSGTLNFSTVNGIGYTGTKANYTMIKFLDNTGDTYGNGIVIGGGGATVIGGGESASALAANLSSGGTECMYISNDNGNISFIPNMDSGWANRKESYFNSSGDLYVNRYVYATYLNQSSGTDTPGANSLIMFANDDGYLRKATQANISKTLTPYETNLRWGNTNTNGGVSPVGMSLSAEHSANRLAYINGDLITSEFSSDNGVTWTTHDLTKAQKSWFCTDVVGINVGKQVGSTAACTLNSKTRITITAQNGNSPSQAVYTNPKKLLINVSTANGLEVLIEYRTGTNYLNDGAWSTFGTYAVSGWSGWNDIPLVLGSLGGGSTQTGNIWQLRLTFSVTSLHSSTTYQGSCSIQGLRLFGENAWNTPSNLARLGHIYSYDADQGAIFPGEIRPLVNNTKNLGTSSYKWANVYATKFIGALQGNADTATSATSATTATTAANLSGFTNTTSTATAVDSATQNGHVYVSGTSGIYNISDGACFVQAYSASWVAQIYQDYRTGQIALRGKNNGTWQDWRKVWDSVNLKSETAAASGTTLSLVTTGEKATWNAKGSGTITSVKTTAGAHTTIDVSSGAANFNVPTKTSHLTNDSGFVTTDTKNTAGSTDTQSKIYLIGATSQAANPQTYSQDTAYVGTDGCVYSGGNKVEVISNNAGYHNSVYRGKSLGTSITEAQWAAISAGTFDDLYIGDYWTLSTTLGSTTSNVQYVIAGFDYWWNCGDSYPQSSNKHHVVLVPASYLYSAQMNTSNITTGGYIGSTMYTTNLANARTGISTLFGDHLYSVRRLFTNSVNASGQATGWAWATSSVDLMNENMVYGSSVWTTSGFEVGVDRTILPLFALNPASASIRAAWWLRSVAAPSGFACVGYYGSANYYYASYSSGVRPAFAIY